MNNLDGLKDLAYKPYWGVIFFGASLVLLASKLIYGLANVDTYFHLRVGQEILKGNWSPGNMGHFNSADNEEWVSTQWISQTVLAFIYENMGGYAGLVIFMGLFLIAFTATVYYILRKHTTGLIAGLLTFAFLWAHFSWVSLRPQMLSFLLIMITAHLWIQASRNGTIPWLTIPLMALWPNLHGIWIAGLANIAVFTIAYSLDRGWRGKQWLVLLGSVFATFCNPEGWRLWEGVVSVTSRGGVLLDEWGPPDYMTVHSGLAFLMLALMVVFLARAKPQNWTIISVAVMAIGWAIWSSRSMAFSSLMVALVIAVLIGGAVKVRRWEWSSMAAGAVGVFAILLLVFPTQADSLRAAGIAPWVTSILDAASSETEETPVLTSHTVANYALFANPTVPMPIHGYLDAFTSDELTRMQTIWDVDLGYEFALEETKAKHAILQDGNILVAGLKKEGWEVQHVDEGWVYMTAPNVDKLTPPAA